MAKIHPSPLRTSILCAALCSALACGGDDTTKLSSPDSGGPDAPLADTSIADAGPDALGLGKPTAVIATADVSKGGHVRWSAPMSLGKGIKNYTVTSTPNNIKVTTPDANTTTAFFPGLMVGQSYTFVVTANDGSDGPPSDPSNPITIVGPGVVGVSTCAGNGHNTVYWPPVGGATSYNLYWAIVPGVTKLTGSKIANATSPYLHGSLLNGTTFYYVVTSVDSTATESAVSDEITATTTTDVRDAFFVSSYNKAGDKAVEIFDCFSHVPTLSQGGNRSISGSDTNIGAASAMNVWVDKTTAALYLATGTNTVDVWNNATTVTGNVPPTRVLTGSATKIATPSGIVFDSKHDVLYVSNVAGSVSLWSPGSKAQGNQPPTATITGANTKLTSATQLAVDEANDRLYVAGAYGVMVFNGASKLIGTQNIAPSRLIDFGTTTTSGYGMDIDLTKDILYVGSRETNAVYMFDSASTLAGTATPNRFIQGMDTLSPTYTAMQVHVVSDTLYLLQDSAASVHIWNNASKLNGATPASDKDIKFTLSNSGGFHYVP